MNISELANVVAAETLGAPSFTVEAAVRDAAIEFFTKTLQYQVEQDASPVPANTSEIDLDLPSSTTLAMILTMQLNGLPLKPITRDELERYYPFEWQTKIGTPTNYLYFDDSTVQLFPYPATTTTGSLRIRFAVVPTQAATTLPDTLAARYRDAFICGAKARLFRMANVVWSNPPFAEKNEMLFRQAVNTARTQFAYDMTRTDHIVRVPV
jgi:hypothetical protein